MEARNTLVILMATLMCSLVQAATVTDDFNRADTVPGEDYSVAIGPGWVNADGAPSAGGLVSNRVQPTAVSDSGSTFIALNTEVKTLNSGAMTEYTLSGIVQLNHSSGSASAGMVFNYQDMDNHYILRYNGLGTIQILRKNNGNVNSLGGGSFSPVESRPYEITIHSREAYVFEISIVDTVTAMEVYATTNSADSLVTSEDGYGGFYAAVSTAVHFDDFSLTSTERSPTAVYDNFDRANTVADHDTTVSLGSSWDEGTGNPNNLYKITSKAAAIDVAGTPYGPFILVNNELGTLNDGSGTNFTVMGTLDLNHATAGFVGLVFNYQDTNNYYCCRFGGDGTLQLLRIVNGATASFLSEANAFTHVPSRPYEITITSSEPYFFDVSVRDTVSNSVVYSNSGLYDSLENFKDGLGGFYRSTGLGACDSFYLDSTGAPAPDSGYIQWAGGWGVDIGTDLDDPDNDGLINVYEYGLGGDPTNELDQGISPEFQIVGGQFSYIHPQVADPDSGIVYFLELTGNLSDPWLNSGYTVDGTNDTGFALDFVTNSTSTVENEKFIRLIIETQP